MWSAAPTRATTAPGSCSSPSAARRSPLTHAAAERVEERWAQLASPAEFEALRASLLRLLTGLKDQ